MGSLTLHVPATAAVQTPACASRQKKEPTRAAGQFRSRALIVPLVVVTETVSPTDWPWLSLTVIVHPPAATDVTVKVTLGPGPDDGVNVAMPAHDGVPFVAVSVPV
jgi:hypothetical protein